VVQPGALPLCRKEHDRRRPRLRELITYYPKKQYWVQLSFMYSEQNQETKQLGAMETAYVQGMLEKDGEYRNMASLLLNAEVPYKARKRSAEGFEKDIVEDNSKNWELLCRRPAPGAGGQAGDPGDGESRVNVR
jgi:hypothetical protein